PEPGDKEPRQPITPVDLDKLAGMYYGFRSDLGGYECGGICWDFYTFLPDHKVVVGPPANGGPEAIDCDEDACLSYTIESGQLKLSDGTALTIGKSEDG